MSVRLEQASVSCHFRRVQVCQIGNKYVHTFRDETNFVILLLHLYRLRLLITYV